MKSIKFLVVLLAVVFANILCIPNDARASAEFSFDEIMMVDQSGSYVEQDEFWPGDTSPWLYLKLPESQITGQFADLNFTFSCWQDPQSAMHSETGGLSLNRENWISLSSWDSIPHNDKIGDWNVCAGFIGFVGMGSGSTSFTVNPEPISMILFLFGGMPLAASLYQKKKKALKV